MNSETETISRTQAINRITILSLVINLALSGLKYIAGIIGHSHAVIADATHSLSDCFTDIAVLWGAKYWDRPPDDDHPHGHQRLEILLTLLIAVSLFLVALAMLYGALSQLRQATVGPHIGVIAGLSSLISIIVKEAIYQWTMMYAKKYKSQVLVANAWHHRSDGISSIPAAATALVAAFLPEWYFLDSVGTIVVSVFIVAAAYKIGRPSFNQLIDAGASRELKTEMNRIVNGTPGVINVHKVRTRYIGSSSLSVDMHVVVNAELTVREGHDISEMVQKRIEDELEQVVDVVVHIEPD